MPVRIFSLPEISPSLESVMGRLGYNPKKTELDQAIINQISLAIEESRKWVHPSGITLDDKIINNDRGQIITSSGLTLPSEKLAAILTGAEKITLLACTIGNDLKEQSSLLAESDQLTRAVILDAIASESVEVFADYITETLTQENRLLGFRPTMRYSPGYGDLKTSIHQQMLPLLQTEKIGVSSDPVNFILYPEKSISAVIGWIK